MSDLASNIHIVLRDGGYSTWNESLSRFNAIAFEDDALMGFVCLFETAETLLRTWREAESNLLNTHAAPFRSAGEKAWNVYCAFLTHAAPSDDQVYAITWVEENLERTRKLAAANVVTRADVDAALLPLLPIASKPVLDAETTSERLSRRVQIIAPTVAEVALDETVPAVEVARRLGADR